MFKDFTTEIQTFKIFKDNNKTQFLFLLSIRRLKDAKEGTAIVFGQ